MFFISSIFFLHQLIIGRKKEPKSPFVFYKQAIPALDSGRNEMKKLNKNIGSFFAYF